MTDIFVSYNREDLPIAQKIVDGLTEEGLDVWLDMDLQAGQNYDEITEERLHTARAVVVLWSSRSVKSRWVRAEATIGARKNVLVPVMIEECDRPVMFELIQCTDLSGWDGDKSDPRWAAAVAVIRHRLAASPPKDLLAPAGERLKASKLAKKTKSKSKPKKEPRPRGGGGMATVALMLILFAMVSVVGLYFLRPDLVKPVLASLASGPGGTASAVDLAAAAPETIPAPQPAVVNSAAPEPGRNGICAGCCSRCRRTRRPDARRDG